MLGHGGESFPCRLIHRSFGGAFYGARGLCWHGYKVRFPNPHQSAARISPYRFIRRIPFNEQGPTFLLQSRRNRIYAIYALHPRAPPVAPSSRIRSGCIVSAGCKVVCALGCESASNFGSDSFLMKFGRGLALVSPRNQRHASKLSPLGFRAARFSRRERRS